MISCLLGATGAGVQDSSRTNRGRSAEGPLFAEPAGNLDTTKYEYNLSKAHGFSCLCRESMCFIVYTHRAYLSRSLDRIYSSSVRCSASI